MQSDIQQIQQQLDSLELKYRNHTHDTINSFAIPYTNLKNFNYYGAINVVTLTPTLIKNLFTQYQILVPAQGVNNIIIVEGITARIYYGGTAYTGTHPLQFTYTNTSGAAVTTTMANTFINSTSSVYNHVAGVTSELAALANTPIVVSVPMANPAMGNSSITFWVKYRIVNL